MKKVISKKVAILMVLIASLIFISCGSAYSIETGGSRMKGSVTFDLDSDNYKYMKLEVSVKEYEGEGQLRYKLQTPSGGILESGIMPEEGYLKIIPLVEKGEYKFIVEGEEGKEMLVERIATTVNKEEDLE